MLASWTISVLFVGAGLYAASRLSRVRARRVRVGYGLHVLMAVVMVVTAWLQPGELLSWLLAAVFLAAAAWFVVIVVRGVVVERAAALAVYHGFMMVAMAAMLVAMTVSADQHGHEGHHGGSADVLAPLGLVLVGAAVVWLVGWVSAVRPRRASSDVVMTRSARNSAYEAAMAAGMAVMCLTH